MEYPMMAQIKKLPNENQRRAIELQKQEVARSLDKELALLAEERKERAARLGLKFELN
jgi:hypothetical protein